MLEKKWHTGLCQWLLAGILGAGAAGCSTTGWPEWWSRPRTFVLPGEVKMTMMYCPAGSFTMGSPVEEPGRMRDETEHPATLEAPFWLGETEVTQAQWLAVTGTNPANFKGPELPVEQVTWLDAKDFCKKLNRLTENSRPAGYYFDLPSETEWEYACRAGTGTAFCYGNASDAKKMNHNSNYPCGGGKKGEFAGKTIPVSDTAANAWGLQGMHGNVREWCRDEYRPYPGSKTDRVSPGCKVLRGGSWLNDARECRSAARRYEWTAVANPTCGLRVALVRDPLRRQGK